MNVRKSAALALGQIGGSEAVSALLLAVRDGAPTQGRAGRVGAGLRKGRRPLIAPLAEDCSTGCEEPFSGHRRGGMFPRSSLLKRAAMVNRAVPVNTLREGGPWRGWRCWGSRFEPLPAGSAAIPLRAVKGSLPALCAGGAIRGGGGMIRAAFRRTFVLKECPETSRPWKLSPPRLTGTASDCWTPFRTAFPRNRRVLRSGSGRPGRLFLLLVQVLEARGIPVTPSCAARVAARLERSDPAAGTPGASPVPDLLSRSQGVRPGVFLKPFLRMSSGQVRLARHRPEHGSRG